MKTYEIARVPQKRGGVARLDRHSVGVARQWPPHWEMHPVGDELLHVLAGEVEIEILAGTRVVRRSLTAGRFAIVPRGTWHRPIVRSPEGVTMLHVTPGDGTEATFEELPPPLRERGKAPRARRTRGA